MGNLTTILRRFCSTTREAISGPWRAGGYVWATDGRIAVRVDEAHFDEIELAALPDADGKPDASVVCEWDAIGDMAMHAPVWTRSNLTRCECCGGSGRAGCVHCGHEDDCGECDGSGAVMDPQYIELDPSTKFHWSLVHRILSLESVMVATVDDTGRLYFAWADGVGVAMANRR